VYHAVLTALSGDSTRPKAVLSAPKAEDTVTFNQTSLSLNDVTAVTPAPTAQTGRKPAPTYRPAPRGSYTAPAVKPRPADPVKPAWPSPFQRVTPLPRKIAQERPASAPAEQPVEHPASLSAETVRPVDPAEASAKAPEPQSVRVPGAVPEPVSAAPVSAEPASVIQPQPAAPAEATQPEIEPWLIRGELFHTYIMVEQGDKIILIDKHAAHERANFDRLKAADYQPMVQELLAPVTFTPAPEERAVLLEQTGLLARFGFDVEEFGSAALAVRSVPDYLDTGDIEDALLELARRIRETGAADPAAARDELMHTMACKAAIKGGQKNGPEELTEVARLVMSGAVKYCPHGRPVAIELTKYQLEKQFKRA
jgi:DNA mismatch repair protein MutL